MIADSFILKLPKVSLATKDNLPISPGIYYVIDEQNLVWYIGKAKNIRNRWQGKSHHRFSQLESQKNHYFSIYYRVVDESELAKIEKEEIEKYTPQLNTSKVKTKTFRPTETLLRETLIKIQEFAFVIGVEHPTKKLEVISFVLGKRKNAISPVIHIAINPILIKEKLSPNSEENISDIIHSMFQTRKQYAKKWEVTPKFHGIGASVYRLYVNNFIIEYSSMIMSQLVMQEFPLDFNPTFLAQESIPALTEESLSKLKNRIIEKNRSSYFTHILQNLTAYQNDLINIHFNDSVEKEKLKQTLVTVCKDYESGKKGFGSRSQSILDKKSALINLANTKGIDIKKNENVINVRKNDQIGVYITPFNFGSIIISGS